MSRIDSGEGKHRATIEHCIPQAVSTEKERLDYKNMLAVCWGNRDAHLNSSKSCDAKRGSLPKEQQDMKKLNVFDGRTLAAIGYGADGTIFSDDADLDEDLNKRLNLNCEVRRLKECRLQSLRALHREINRKYPNATAPKKYFRELLEYYTRPCEKRTPYIGIIIAWLRKKV